MLLEAVIIILREVLEAALLTSILLALSKILGVGIRWFAISLLLGLIGAYAYASNLGWISEQFDYAGQELTNSLIQLGIFLLAGLMVILITSGKTRINDHAALTSTMIATIALAVTREFSEIILYMQSFASDSSRFYPVLGGAFIGAGIGVSIGTVIYYALSYRPGAVSRNICLVTLAFVVAGILGQTIPQLQQIDWLPIAGPVWDSSSFIAEDSTLGQLLYAVLGYESTPSQWHLAVYLAGLISLLALSFFSQRDNTQV